MAVQGGLLAATIAQRKEEEFENAAQRGNALPILSFLGAKLVAYTLLGALLGLFGSFFQLSLTAQIILQTAVVIFMIGTAANLLSIHPIFRYFVIQPPKFLYKLVRNQAKSKAVFAPALLGAFTVFIPCGTTQAMMALALGTREPTLGAATMFAFTLGTSPLFFILAYVVSRLGDALNERFMKVAASGIILLAAFNLNNTLALAGIEIDFTKPFRYVYCTVTFCKDSPYLARIRGEVVLGAAVKKATITIREVSYTPNNITVRAGSDVTLNLVNESGTGCTQSFTIPKLGIRKIIPLGSSDVVSFTAPSQPTQLAFMCSMGMFRGVINVI